MDKDRYIYFLYSEQQHKERQALENKLYRNFIPGEVILNGRRILFTEKAYSPTNAYYDSKVVAEGLESKMVYKDIETR